MTDGGGGAPPAPSFVLRWPPTTEPGWTPTPPPPRPSSSGGDDTRGERLARWSLLLGIVSFLVLPVLAAVAAIVTGVKARNVIDSTRGTAAGRRAATAGVVLGIVNAALFSLAVILVVVLVARGRGHSDYRRLRVGDCYNLTSSGYVDQVACARPHHAEVTGSFQLAGTTYPGAAGFRAQAQPKCQALASRYLGSSTRIDLSYVWITPNRSAWDGGTRIVVCGLQNADRGPRTGSVRA